MTKTNEREFQVMRINLKSATVPPCTMHGDAVRDHVLVIHGKGSPQAALYFCPPCEKSLLERLLKDYLTFPGLKKEMGELSIPATSAVED